MKTLLTRRAGLHLLVLVFGFLLMACKAGGAGGSAGSTNRWQGQTIYNKVGLHAEPTKKGDGFHAYSTNYIGLSKLMPAGTKFTAREVGGSKIVLAAEDGAVVTIDFVKKHHAGMSFDAWMDREFSTSPVDLPTDLDSKERAAIQAGRYEVGMSRAALFLAIGYPPATLSPNLEDASLKYEIKRFNGILFTFDAKGRLSDIKN